MPVFSEIPFVSFVCGIMCRHEGDDSREKRGYKKCVPRLSPSARGLGVPMYEREDKGTRDGINRPRDYVKLRSFPETAKFTAERRLRVSAKYLIRRSGISPPSRLVARSTPAPRERKEVYHIPFTWRKWVFPGFANRAYACNLHGMQIPRNHCRNSP